MKFLNHFNWERVNVFHRKALLENNKIQKNEYRIRHKNF